MTTQQLLLLLMFGAVLAVSLAACFLVPLGLLRQGYRWLASVCPHCSQRRLRHVADLRQPEPGSLYLCIACSRRWLLPSGRHREFQDASGPAFDLYFQPPAPPQAIDAKERLIRLLELAASYNDKGIFWRRDSPAQVQHTRQQWQREIDALLAELGEASLPAELLAALRSGAVVCDDSGRFVEQARRWLAADG